MKWDRSMAAPGLVRTLPSCFNWQFLIKIKCCFTNFKSCKFYMLTYKSFAVNWCFHLLLKSVILFQEKASEVSRIMPLLAPFRDSQTQLTAIMAFSLMLSIIEVTVWCSCEYQSFSFFRSKTLHWRALCFFVLVCPCVPHLILSLQFVMKRFVW